MQRRHRLLGYGLGVLWLAGCGGKLDQAVETTTTNGQMRSPAGTDAARRGAAMVRVVNAFPTRDGVDVSAGERTVFATVPFKGVTQYAEIDNNVPQLQLHVAGGAEAIADNSEMLSNGVRYTVLAVPNAKGGAELRVVRDDLVPTPGKARLRMIHAAPTVSRVDVAIKGSTETLFEDVDYGAKAGYRDVDPTTATLEIRQDQAGAEPIRMNDVRLDPGKAYTIVLVTSEKGRVETITFDDAVQETARRIAGPGTDVQIRYRQ